MFVDIILNKRAYELDRLFCYEVPNGMENKIEIGKRVIVPFGPYKKEEGIIIAIIKDPPKDIKLKTIDKLLDDEPIVTKEGFEIAKFIKKRYLCTYYDALRLVMPSGIKAIMTQKIFIEDNVDITKYENIQFDILKILHEYNGIYEEDLLEKLNRKTIKKELLKLLNEKAIRITMDVKSSLNHKFVEIVTLTDEIERINSYIIEKAYKKAQVRVLKILLDNKSMALSDLMLIARCSKPTITGLLKENFIELDKINVIRNPYLEGTKFENEQEKEATNEQKNAIDKLTKSVLKNKSETFLIHGVTGSGKTEVYLQVIDRCIKNNKNAIVLVPEIALTTQMVDRFYKRFQKGVAVIHSGLTINERYDQYKLIKSGEINVVVGARSAIFAPIKNIGVIIVDEEHEGTYKSEATPKYDAIEVAKQIANMENATLVLSSATPSVVSYYRAISGEYKLITMENRYNMSNLPSVTIVDMREELKDGNFSPISRKLKDAIDKRIKNNEQVVMFINRRGYSTFVSCRSCGFVVKCPHCDVSLTYHSGKNKMVCHYCMFETEYFKKCPRCQSTYIKHFGTGTEKLEEEIKKIFPEGSVIRMDADTTYKKFAHQKILKKFEEENISILLGTQMVTKGLDFANVTLSVVLAADGGLFLDDYRSLERTFAQITQVMGRAGRGKKVGEGIIQTYNPEHFAILCAKEHNYNNFFDLEIKLRKQMQFPPYCDIINITCQSEEETLGEECMRFVHSKLLENGEKLNFTKSEYNVYPFSKAPITRIRGKYRFRILIKCKNSYHISNILEKVYNDFHKQYKSKNINLSVDINPLSML